MQTLFLTLVLSLIAILQAQANPDLYKNVLGRWYLKAEIADKDVSEKNVEVVGPMTITALEGGNLEAKNTILMNGQCQEVKLVLEKTHEPRKFTAYGGERHVFIERTHVKDHYILYCEGQLKGQQVRMAKLVGRDSESNEEALEEFRKFVEDTGFNPEKIFIPEQKEACTPEEV